MQQIKSFLPVPNDDHGKKEIFQNISATKSENQTQTSKFQTFIK